MAEHGSLGGNLGYAVLAQGVSLLSSIAMSLLVPKALGVEDYAYWQLFILYSSYVGLALFGIHDGIFLRIGGIKVDDIDWPRVKGEFFLVLIGQLLLAVAATLAIFAGGLADERAFVFLAVLIFGVVVNPAAFLFYVLRAANLPNIFSTANVLSGSIWAAALVALIVVGPENFQPYIVVYIVSQAISSCFCYLHFRKVFACRPSSPRLVIPNLKTDCVAGLKVTMAYYAGSLVVGSTRMLIDGKWGLEAFGIFSFSVSLVNFLLTFMAQVSMVIFPVIRRMGKDSQSDVYRKLRNGLVGILPLMYVLYFPGCYLLKLWLPQYEQSLLYLAIILPVCFFDCKMQLLVNTYLKTYRKENALFWLNAATLVLSLLACFISAFVVSDILLTAVAMVASIGFRSVVSEVYLNRLFCIKAFRPIVGDVLLAAWFVVSAFFFESLPLTIIGVLIYYFYNRRSLLAVCRMVRDALYLLTTDKNVSD
ncbi:lipopolysaccharide biosynthesis protein [Olsenella uli]|uniref:lipopolysaccharide biosynthesis protein n=1 Tax=Olsenella uli TaxID=133926 RepID=UPI0012AB6D14|nr:hypothetical protein [Olsenella uli]